MKRVLSTLSIVLTALTIYSQVNLDSCYNIWQDENQTDSIRAAAFKEYIWEGYLLTRPDTADILTDELIAFGINESYPPAHVWGLRLKGITYHYRNDYPKALDYYYQSLDLSKDLGYLPEEARLLSDIGVIYTLQGEYPKALDCFARGLEISEKVGKQSTIATFLSLNGSLYREQGDYPKALDYYSRSLRIQEQLDNQLGVAVLLQNIGLIYDKQGDYSEALDYYDRSLGILDKLGNQRVAAGSLLNIGGIYFEQEDYPKALNYYGRSLEIAEDLDDRHMLAKSLGNIGMVHEEQENYAKAMDYYSRGLNIHEQQGDQKGVAHALTNIGNLYKVQSNYSRALDYCQRGYSMALTIGALDKQKYACECLYEVNKAMGKGDAALTYLEKIRTVEDSMKAQETAKKLQQMEFQRIMLRDSMERAEEARLVQEAHEGEMRREERARNIAFGLGAFILLFAIGMYSRLRYVRKTKAIIEAERDRSETLLLNILPSEIAEELKEKGKADARDFEMVSILFTDFKGFTEQSAKLSAADLVAEINHCFEAFDSIMEKYGIEKIKTIGDAYMAAGGLPVPTEDSVKNTVLAALEMQNFITRRKAEKEARDETAFQMRVGIHTGPVVAGIVGVKKFQYDIWGDTVNTASRMETSGEVGKVNISNDTYECIKDDPEFAFESRGKVEAKGKGEIRMYFVSRDSRSLSLR